MRLKSRVAICLSLVLMWVCVTNAFCDSTFDRELIVKGDKTRAMKVESVFKELMAAYEDEDAQGFLDLVSDERFRQDYMTFTDALYNDFRSYEIRQVDYWIDRVVADHVKQFLYVKWEKRYENLDDGQQLTTTGYSRFLFDEVEGDYLLIELAGNPLFGGSLPEWVEEMPQISGQEADPIQQTPTTPVTPGAVCDSSHLSLCDGSNCSSNGGYWYNGTCNSAQGLPDLIITSTQYHSNYPAFSDTVDFTVRNVGNVATTSSCQIGDPSDPSVSGTIPVLAPNQSYSGTLSLTYYTSGASLLVDSTHVVTESNEGNNTHSY